MVKVYGYTAWAPYGNNRQGRHIVAAKSVSEVLRITGLTRYQFNNLGFETGNEEEILQAMSEPGTVFVRPLDAMGNVPWDRKES